MAVARRAGWKSALATAALALVAVVAALAAAEGILRLLGYGALYEIYSRPTLFWRHDALLGWSHEPGSVGIYRGPRPFPIEFENEVRLNSLGLRGPELGARRPDELRVLLLGDSVVAGFEVAFEKHFGTLVERRLERWLDVPVRVLNAGVRGYGTDQTLLYYQERGRALGADIVVFVHSANDLDDNMSLHRMRRPFGKPGFALDTDGRLQLVGSPVPDYPACSAWRLDDRYAPTRIDGPRQRALCVLQMRLADRSALFGVASIGLGRFSDAPRMMKRWIEPRDVEGGAPQEAGFAAPFVGAASALAGFLAAPTPAAAKPPALDRAELSPAQALTSALLLALGREVRSDGAHLLVVIRPKRLVKLDHERLIAEIDLRQLPFPVQVAGSYRFVNDAHYNELGHFYFAEALAPVIREVYESGPTPGERNQGH